VAQLVRVKARGEAVPPCGARGPLGPNVIRPVPESPTRLPARDDARNRPGDAQGRHLAPPESRIRQEQSDQPVRLSARVSELVDLLMRQEATLSLAHAWQVTPLNFALSTLVRYRAAPTLRVEVLFRCRPLGSR
jgi:hypothetical protein